MELSERPQFENTAISDEGVYTCQVDITEMGIVIEKRIDFKVIGELVLSKSESLLGYITLFFLGPCTFSQLQVL